MGIRRNPWTEAYIARRLKEGRGQGESHTYQPWTLVQEFSSRGTQSRIPSAALGRTVHVMSNIERSMFLMHEYAGFEEYREQFPIPREITLGAAKALGIRHPVYPRTKVPVVMTFDALVWRRSPNGQVSLSAWDAKPARELGKKRVLEKLSLHKAACHHWGIPHQVFTESSVSAKVKRNVEWLRTALPRHGESQDDVYALVGHKTSIVADLFARSPRQSIHEYCNEYDRKGGHEEGTALRAIKQLIHARVLEVDLDTSDITALPVPTPQSPLLPHPREVV